jgi:hypothetical protein
MKTLKEIREFSDSLESLISINDFVYEVVPALHPIPYEIVKGNDTVENLYDRFLKREVGGWCSLSAQYMKMILDEKNIPCYTYNYGIPNTDFTHMVVIAKDYLFDPYFNKVFVGNFNNILDFKSVIFKIKNRDFSFFPKYGDSIKFIKYSQFEPHRLFNMNGESWEKRLVAIGVL